MTADLLLLSVACAVGAGGLASMVIRLKRMAQAWWSDVLDGVAIETK